MKWLYVRPDGDDDNVALREILVANLRRVMREHKLNQMGLAKIAGKSQAAISSWLNMGDTPSLEALERIATTLGFPPEDFFRNPDTPPDAQVIRFLQEIAHKIGYRIEPDDGGGSM